MVRNEATRQYIIEQTASIFNKKGYIGTYLSDLTAATGLSKGSIYGNFKDKNEVAVEAFRYNLHHVVQPLKTGVSANHDTKGKLLFFVDFYRKNHERIFRNGGCAILNTAVDADDGNEALKEEAKKALLNWKKMLEEIVEEGIKTGELRECNAEQFAAKMIALIEGSVLLAKTTGQIKMMMDNLDFLEMEIKKMALK